MFTLNYINEHVYTIYMPQNVPFIGYLQMDIVYLNDALATYYKYDAPFRSTISAGRRQPENCFLEHLYGAAGRIQILSAGKSRPYRGLPEITTGRCHRAAGSVYEGHQPATAGTPAERLSVSDDAHKKRMDKIE